LSINDTNPTSFRQRLISPEFRHPPLIFLAYP
jgi:hypothetical protein